ncbi:MAG: glycine cleavage system protein GcvH [Oscillospiraceae bacterium]|jgi:glycine cleavage system H protein|nr:glycine cleavage system protein GcvH [Oscillospiraceae bacterium]
MTFPQHLSYTKTHEWIESLGGGSYRIGLTDYAQSALGDVVFVNLPEPGDTLAEGASFCDVESVKAVSDVYSPLSGAVSEINEVLLDSPERINQDCYAAWLIVATADAPGSDWLDAGAYSALAEAEANAH